MFGGVFIYLINDDPGTVQEIFKFFSILSLPSPPFKTGQQFTDADNGNSYFLRI
jgi:hypothetical protein